MKRAWKQIGIAFAGLWATGCMAWAQRPNLIAIVTDDQGRWAMGAYGNREIYTPNMDRLAREGARFTNAFANTPVCSPSRGTYYTGLYSTEIGITDWLESSKPGEADLGTGLQALTWPEVLRRNGYATALCGKWHLGELAPYHPTRLGFDHFMGFLEGSDEPINPMLEVNGKRQQVQGCCADLVTDDAIAFLRTHRNGPFAICLNFREPHTPYGPTLPEDAAHYKDLDPTVPMLKGLDIPALKKSTKQYYASISSIDRNLGKLLAALDESGLASKTLIMFASDHGYNLGRHYINTKGNGTWMAGGIPGPTRPNMWDTSLCIPLIFRWPGVIKPGQTIPDMVSYLDMFRTLLGALGVPVPAEAKAHGTDFSPLLRGQSIAHRDILFGQYDLHNSGLAYMRMARTEHYKLVRYYHAHLLDELYDLDRDPDELHNLIRGDNSTSLEEVRRDLDAKITAWMKSINDPLLTDYY